MTVLYTYSVVLMVVQFCAWALATAYWLKHGETKKAIVGFTCVLASTLLIVAMYAMMD